MYIIKSKEILRQTQDYTQICEINISETCELCDVNQILLCKNLEKIKVTVVRICLKLLLDSLHKFTKLYDITIYNKNSSYGLPIIGSVKSFENNDIFYCDVEFCPKKHYRYMCDICDTIYKLAESKNKKVIIKHNELKQILNCLPSTIEELTLYIKDNEDNENIFLTNLPFSLKQLHIVTNINVNNFFNKYIEKIKIPFNCEITIIEEFNEKIHNNENSKMSDRLLIIQN